MIVSQRDKHKIITFYMQLQELFQYFREQDMIYNVLIFTKKKKL